MACSACRNDPGWDSIPGSKCSKCGSCLRCGSYFIPHDCAKNGAKGYCGLSEEDINKIALVDYGLCGQPGAQGAQSEAEIKNKIEIKNFYWEDENIILELKTGEKYVLKNPYVSGVSFEGLDCQKTDIVNLEFKMTFEKDK